MIEIIQDSSQFNVLLAKTDPISYMSHSISLALSWLLGHGIYGFDIVREKSVNGRCLLRIKGLTPSKKFVFSSAVPLKELFEAKYIPELVPEIWQEIAEVDGIIRMHSYSGETIFNSYELKQDLSLAEFSFGVADTITSFFALGCTHAKYQCSEKISQHWFNFGMDQKELSALLEGPTSYDPDKLIESLPLTFSPKNK